MKNIENRVLCGSISKSEIIDIDDVFRFKKG
jgi:hypothetical protein